MVSTPGATPNHISLIIGGQVKISNQMRHVYLIPFTLMLIGDRLVALIIEQSNV